MKNFTSELMLTILCNAVSLYSPPQKEREVAEYLVGQASQLGWNSYRDEAGNFVAERGSGRPVIYFLGHIDTVPGEIPVRIEDGKLYGRGSVDAKGSTVAFLCGASRLPADHPGTLRMIGAVEEEGPTSKGARFAVERYPTPDYLIIGEPSGWDKVTLGYKGSVQLSYRAEQEKSHGASQWASVGTLACELYHHIATIPELAKITADSPFYAVTKTVRTLNTQDDDLRESVDMYLTLRLPPEVDAAQLRRELEAFDYPGEITVHEILNAVRCPKSGPLVAVFRKAIKVQQGNPRTSLKTGTSDMNIVVPIWQCPCLAYGPGDSTLDHTPHEYIEIEEFQRSIRIIRNALDMLLH